MRLFLCAALQFRKLSQAIFVLSYDCTDFWIINLFTMVLIVDRAFRVFFGH